MPKYFFTAKYRQGEPYSDIREARNESELAKTLREEGYVLIAAELKEAVSKTKFEIKPPFFGGVSFKEKMMITKNLQVMIGAGVSLPKSLQTLAELSQSKKLNKTLMEVAQEVVKGKSFSGSLEKYPDIFSELFRNMVKVGEESGTLEENLGVLNRHMEREYELRSKIQGALMYPAVIILAMMGIGIMMLVMVVPKLAETFKDLQIELPLTTKIVIGMGDFLITKWYFVVLLAAAAFFLFRVFLRTKIGRKTMGEITIKMPIISPIVKKTNAAHTVGTLSSLLSAGVSVVRALEIIADTLGNFYFKRAVEDAAEKVKKGSKLSDALAPYTDLFPITVIQMMRVGEETGETSDVLGKLGSFFEEEVASATKNMASVVEPVLMLVVGGVVGFFAISMVQPMYSMLSGIK